MTPAKDEYSTCALAAIKASVPLSMYPLSAALLDAGAPK